MTTMKITPELLEAAYNLLKEMRPFDKWCLPNSTDIRFRVIKSRDRQGDVVDAGDAIVLRISDRYHGNLTSLLGTVAHEMVHIRQWQYPAEKSHGPTFRRLARQVCKHHPSFDPKTF